MAMTLVEKVMTRASHGDPVVVGQVVVCDVDTIVFLDLQFNDAIGWQEPTRIADPDRVVIIMDHAVPAPSIGDAEAGVRARAFAKRFGVRRFYDVGRHGICHQVIAEEGLARPGEVLLCSDSHTCAAGAFGSLARGLGPAEMLQILCLGQTWFQVPPTIRYLLEGQLSEKVSGKDVFLWIAGSYGAAMNTALEFGGPGLATLGLSDRRTIATQGAEVGADFTMFPADEICVDYLRPRCSGEKVDTFFADEGAQYLDTRSVNLAQIEPQVARPGTVINNSFAVTELAGTHIDQFFIGSCANGQLEDLIVAAKILDGKQVAAGSRMIVTPASQKVWREAAAAGILETLVAAGAVVTNSTCGACLGYHMGLIAPGERCLTSSTRNFRGRMGSPDAEIFMASPATVAASAIEGCIVDPRGT
ncbi:MAG: 3-isopropylmalate dehydratase large subunit [Betaproteobacteria bacterium]|nr:3-isopropylmalate dehydratase large subunit [Betaproteobacteria bacterium]